MTMGKRGSRKIVVNETAYRWNVSKWHMISDWHSRDLELLDPRWLEQARKFGLGDTADVAFTITIELYNAPVSKTVVKYYAKIVDGFLGPEQFTTISPRLIRYLIEKALVFGWVPEKSGNFYLEVVENSGDIQRPALLVLPELNNDVKGYQNRVVPICIFHVGDQLSDAPPNTQQLPHVED